jgi:small subunit ribosomal protein S17
MKKSIGLDVRPPEKKCEDARCPWHGRLSVRGKVFRGTVRSAKAAKTAVVEFGFHKFIKKYERYERRKSQIVAYNPPCVRAKEGDLVVIAECRPISKTKSFTIVAVEGGESVKAREAAKSREGAE